MRVAGVTILFNPMIEVERNILSYLEQVEQLYIIDNSDKINRNLTSKNIKSLPGVIEIPNEENIGVAAALNKSAERAIEDGYDLLLTMDQDSKISDNLVSEMLREFEKNKKIGILSPFVIHPVNPLTPPDNLTEEIQVAMTSGSIIRLSVYKETGKFLENLFIDYVDHEYCLRLNSHAYKVVQLNSVFLYHKLGEIKQKKLFFKKIFPTNHSPLRLYYRTRNRFFVHKKYKKIFYEYVKQDRVIFLKEIIKIIFYEDEKLKKLKMIILGYYDYRKNILGKYKHTI